MERKWFNSMLFNRGLEYRCGLSKSIESFGPIENNGVNEDPSNLTDMDNNIHSWKNNSENSSYSHGDYLADVSNIHNFLSHKIFSVRDSNGNSYDIYYAYDTNDTKYNWSNNMNRSIESYLRSQICEDSDKDNASDLDIYFNNDICDKVQNSSESHITNIIITRSTNAKNDANDINDTNHVLDTNDIDNPFAIYYTNDTNDIDNPFAIYYTNDTDDIYDPFGIFFTNDTDEISDINDTNDTNDTDDIYDPFAIFFTNDTDEISDINDTNDTDDIYDPFAIYFTNDTDEISDINDTNDTDEISDINDTNDTDEIYGIYDPDDLYDTDIKDLCERSSEIDPRNRKNDTFVRIDYSDPNYMNKLSHLWVQCETCYGINFKQFFPSKLNICEHCGEHLKMSSSDRIELLIDPGTWNPMDEDMVSLDPIEFDSIEFDPIQFLSSQLVPISIQLSLMKVDMQILLKVNGLEDMVSPYPIELDSKEKSLKDFLDADMVSPDPIELDSEEESRKDLLGEDMVSPDPIELDSKEKSLKDFLGEDMVSPDPIELDSKEESRKDLLGEDMDPIAEQEEEEEEEQSYIDRLDSYQERTGLPEAVQTGTGQLNGIPLAIAVMDSDFIAGSMGSVVGEKITRLIEYATNQLLPLIIVCASGGARMQEGSLSLMQMAKISSALYNYQINQKLFYVAILTSPTTGGVTASFGMLGDIIIAEPNATIAFAGKRIIEQLLNEEVPEGSQSADLLFDKGLLDSVVPRHLLKQVLTELFQFHGFVPLTENLTKLGR